MSVGFGVADGGGGNVFAIETEVGFTVGLKVGVCVGVSAGAVDDDAAELADGLSRVGVLLGRAASVILPSTTRVSTTQVWICSRESGWGVGVSVGSTRSGRLQAARINAAPNTTPYRNRFPPDMGSF